MFGIIWAWGLPPLQNDDLRTHGQEHGFVFPSIQQAGQFQSPAQAVNFSLFRFSLLRSTKRLGMYHAALAGVVVGNSVIFIRDRLPRSVGRRRDRRFTFAMAYDFDAQMVDGNRWCPPFGFG